MFPLHVSPLRIALLLLTLLMVSSGAQSGPLVTRNDFVAYDTTIADPWLVSYPDVAIDGNGNLRQLMWTRDAGLPFPETRLTVQLMLNLMNPQGTLTQPASSLAPLPYAEGGGQWVTYTRSRIVTNESGLSAVAFAAKGFDDFQTERTRLGLFVVALDATGQPVDDPVLLFTLENLHNYFGEIEKPSVAISNSGLIAVSATYDIHQTATYETLAGFPLFVYNPATGYVSPRVDPTDRPHPIESDPAYDGDYNLEPITAIGIADDGSLAVAWEIRDDGYAHLGLARYDADLNPVGDVTMPDCDGGAFYDPESCIGPYAQNVSLAMEADGDFYLAWYADGWDPELFPLGKIYARGYNTDGSDKFGPMNVADTHALKHNMQDPPYPTILCNDNGDVLVSWSDARLDPDPAMPPMKVRLLVAQKIDRQGNLVGPNYRIDNPGGSIDWYGWYDDCDLNNAGQAVFTWVNHESERTIWAQLMPYSQIGTYVPGDIDYDFEASVSDLISLVDFMFTGGDNIYWPPALLDFNDDGANGDIGDLVYLVDWMFNNGPIPGTPDEGIRPPMD